MLKSSQLNGINPYRMQKGEKKEGTDRKWPYKCAIPAPRTPGTHIADRQTPNQVSKYGAEGGVREVQIHDQSSYRTDNHVIYCHSHAEPYQEHVEQVRRGGLLTIIW